MKRIEVRLEEADHRALKVLAAARGVTMQALIEALIKQEIEDVKRVAG